MVQVVLSMVVHPRRATQIIQALRSLRLPLQRTPGFISCDAYSEAGHSDALRYVEEWQTEGHLDRQIRSSHYTRLLAQMEEAAEPPELRLDWISHPGGWMTWNGSDWATVDGHRMRQSMSRDVEAKHAWTV